MRRAAAAPPAAARRRRAADRSPIGRRVCRRSTATSRFTGTSGPARCGSRSRASTMSSSSQPASRPVSDRTTSGSIVDSRAAGASSCSSASDRRFCWFNRISRSDRAARTRPSASRSKTRLRSRCSGDLPPPLNPTATCSSMRPTSCCATCTAPATRCVPATTAWTARAALFTCRAPRPFRKTRRSKRRLPSSTKRAAAAAVAAAVRFRVRPRSETASPRQARGERADADSTVCSPEPSPA